MTDFFDKAEAWLDRRIAARMARKLTTGNANFHITRASPSDSQCRLLELLKLTIPDNYVWAAKMLKKAGYSPNGMPRHKSWQYTKKLTDAQLLKEARRR